ncbi:MAG TPA: hypothetical protein VFI25_16845 [Planctomycetota bacterium]|jgi:hypothetical protein|nr:hypothetical protein [Planctomycetota bacterium]
MPTLYLRDVPHALLRRLRDLARTEQRPVSRQAILLLERALADAPVPDPRMLALLKRIARTREKIRRSGRRFPPSERMVREERER